MWPFLLLCLNMWRTLWGWIKGRGQESLEQQATVSSDHCTADSLGEGSENQNCAVSDGNNNSLGNWWKGHPCYLVAKSLASLCPCPEAPWKAELQSDQLVCLAGELSKQRSIQAAAWLLLMAYSQMREQRDDLKTELLKWETQRLSQRRNHRGMKRKGWSEQAVVKKMKAEKQRVMVLNPGNRKEALRGSQKRPSKLTGDSGLLAKGSLTSVIPRGPQATPVSHRPWLRSFCARRENLVTKSQKLSPQLKRKPWEARKKTTLRLESLWRSSDEVMPHGAVQVKPPWRPQRKSSEASVLKQQPQKAARSETHKPLKATDVGLQPSIASLRVELGRARRFPSGLKITSGSIPEVETPRRAHMELRHRAPSRAVPTGVTGVGLQSYRCERPAWESCGKRLQPVKPGAAAQASKAQASKAPTGKKVTLPHWLE